MQNKSVTIAAIFSSYTLTTMSSTNTGGAAGSFTRYNAKKVSEGEAVVLTATVNNGYNFEGWYIDDICVSRNLTYTYTMEKENTEIEVRYSCYTLSTVGYAVNADGKTEAGFNAGTYTQHSNTKLSVGETVTLTATVNDGYNFVGWYVNDNCVETELEYTYTMEKSHVTIKAIYSYYVLDTCAKKCGWEGDSYDHDEFSNSSLYISPVYDNAKVSIGESITVTAYDIEGYTFISWRTFEAEMTREMTYSFTMPAGDFILYAFYLEN